MIIPKLVEYYDRLAADPEEDVAAYGFSRQKISFEIVLHPDGRLHAIEDARVEDGKRQVPRPLVVPGQAKTSGSGLNPGLLWDNAQYMLGYKQDDPKPERSRKAFEAFRERHLALRDEIDDEAYGAVCAFLESWSPQQAADHPHLPDVTSAFGVFRILGAQEYVHDRPAVRSYLQQAGDADSDTFVAPSLVTGRPQPIARLHEPKLKGILGAQSSGAVLVGFNAPAYESYGKSQSYNAPVGEADAFKYCTALNRLTTDRDRRVLLGDTTVTWWADKPTGFENEFIQVLDPPYAEDEGQVARLAGFLRRLSRAADGAAFDESESDVPFYVLGLAPNAARVSVRFWLVGTVQQFAERLGRHLRDLEIGGKPPKAPPLTIQRIIDQTARERKDISPLLGGAVLRAVLSGGAYPSVLVTSVIRRIRADRNVWHQRAAILKAYLNRKARLAQNEESIPVALDADSTAVPYRLGRLFAALEKTQEDAYGKDINATIKDRFLSSASASPRTAFARLLRMHAHHLDKLGKENPGWKHHREVLVQEIMWGVPAASGLPSHLSLDEQALFFIGYYHQRQAFFETKTADGTGPTSDSDKQEA